MARSSSSGKTHQQRDETAASGEKRVASHRNATRSPLAARRSQLSGSYREMARKLPAAQRPMMDPVGTPGVASPDELRILLPEPHALLHAHNKGSWHAKSGIVKLLRWKAQQRCLGCNAASWPAATILYKFWLPETSGMRDEANLIQSQKPAIDGVVDAKVIPDDSIRYLHIAGIWCGTDTENPRVELVFRRATVRRLEAMRKKLEVVSSQ